MPNFTAFVITPCRDPLFLDRLSGRPSADEIQDQTPATTGNPDFERVFRIQMNMLEWMPIFLPAILLAAIYVSDIGAALLGIVWIAGRMLYMRGYTEAAEKREIGFFVQAIAAGLLWLAALVGAVASMLHG
jgi:glutathione S-transferase